MCKYDWYWSKGLHDAEILRVRETELQYNYHQRHPIRNMLELTLDSAHAMFDTSIKALRFYNYKIISGDINRPTGAWWYADTITETSNHITIEIKYTTKQNRNIAAVKIQFDKIEVVR